MNKYDGEIDKLIKFLFFPHLTSILENHKLKYHLHLFVNLERISKCVQANGLVVYRPKWWRLLLQLFLVITHLLNWYTMALLCQQVNIKHVIKWTEKNSKSAETDHHNAQHWNILNCSWHGAKTRDCHFHVA